MGKDEAATTSLDREDHKGGILLSLGELDHG
jgi:hypothetical protein